MNIDFDLSRWNTTKENYRKWWSGELDRPLINLTLVGRDPGRPEPELPRYDFTSFYDLNVPAEAIVDRWLYDLECRQYVGDAFPHILPNFGPGVIAALMGLNLENGTDTVWFTSSSVAELKDIHFEFDTDSVWFKRMTDIYQLASKSFDGLVHLDMTDLGGNMDILQSFRPAENLLMDLYDEPERVMELNWDAHKRWWDYFENFNRHIQAAHPGYTSWTPMYSEDPSYMLQCDFCYMIGQDMFEQFVKPELVATCDKLTNPFYHLDGPGQLTHLDSILEIENLKGVQWVPGAGQPGVTEWPDIYRKIRDAGKLIQFFTNQDEHGIDSLDRIVDQLGDSKGITMIGEVSIEQADRVNEIVERYGQ